RVALFGLRDNFHKIFLPPKTCSVFPEAKQNRTVARGCECKTTTTNRRRAEKSTHMSRFSLDSFFTSADTAIPDSGERGSARRPEPRSFTRVRGGPRQPARVLSK